MTESTTTSLYPGPLFNLTNVAKGEQRAGHGARSSLTISQQKNTEHGRGGGDESERSGTACVAVAITPPMFFLIYEMHAKILA